MLNQETLSLGMCTKIWCSVAQLVEQTTVNRLVAGSIPAWTAKNIGMKL